MDLPTAAAMAELGADLGNGGPSRAIALADGTAVPPAILRPKEASSFAIGAALPSARDALETARAAAAPLLA